MAIDVTDATFETEVIQRSHTTAVVVDLWAEWCGPCKTLGPILEQVCGSTNGQVVLAKVDVDSNPAISQAFQVQSIPAVYAFKDGKVVDGFMGAVPEHVVRQFVDTLRPSLTQQTIASLLAAGDEASLRQALELEPGNVDAVCALAEVLVAAGRPDEALTLLARIPETDRVTRIAASARLSEKPADDYDELLTRLLEAVKADDAARQEYIDIWAVMGPTDPRTARYRKLLTARLY
jgi:putative thioredoxin